MKKYLANLFTTIATVALMLYVVDMGEVYECDTLFTVIDDFIYEVVYLKMNLSWQVYQATYLVTMFSLYLAFVEMVKWEVKYYYNVIKTKVFATTKKEKQKEVHATFIEAD